MIRFRGDIEGLRAVAVLLVILNHLAVPGFSGGFIGVDVFFVISGYLITSLLAAEHARNAERGQGRISIPGFYLRRARRILPAAVLVVAATLVASHTLLNPLRTDEIQHDALWALLFGSNINFIQKATDYFQQGLATSPLQHYWSLAVEEQFYLAWPALFALATRLRRHGSWERRVALTALLLGAASLAWSISDTTSDPASAYFSTLTRGWELALGALIAISARHLTLPTRLAQTLAASGATLLLLSCLVIDDTTPFPGTAALLPTLATAALLLASASHSTVIGRLLAIRPARYLGRISYSMYLWHWPLIVLTQALYPVASTTTPGRLALLATTILLSTTSYHLIEQPFRRLGHGHAAADRDARGRRRARVQARRRGLGAALVGSAVVLTVAWGLQPTAGAQAPARAATAQTTPAAPGATAAAPASASIAPAPDPHAVPAWQALVAGATGTHVFRSLDAALSSTGRIPWDACLGGKTLQGDGAFSPVDACRYGSGRKTAYLVGDSHALMWAAPLAAALAQRDMTVVSLALASCPATTTIATAKITTPWMDAGVNAKCERHKAWVVRFLRENPPDLIIVSDRALYGPNTKGATRAAAYLRSILASHVPAILVGRTPELPPLATCLHGDDASSCGGRVVQTIAPRALFARLARDAGAGYLDPTRYLCSKGRCPPVIDGTIVYSPGDGHHLTTAMGDRLGPILAADVSTFCPSTARQPRA